MTTLDIYTRLLVTPPPHPNESLKGFLLRLSELNGYNHPHWICAAAGFGKWLTPPNDRTFQRLSVLTNTDVAVLRRFSYDGSLVDNRRVLRCHFNNRPIRRLFLELKTARVCPECLDKSPHTHALWDINLVTACPIHGRLLLDRCPRCRERLTWRRAKVASCECGFDLRTTTAPRISGQTLELNQFIAHAAGWIDAKVKPESTFGLPVHALSKLSLGDLLEAIILVGRIWLRGVSETASIPNLPTLSNSGVFLDAATKCFQDWPDKFHASLRMNHHPNNARVFFSFADGLKIVARGETTQKIRQTPFKFIQDAVSDYFYRQWQGTPARTSVFVPHLRREHTEYMTCHDVRPLLRCHVYTVHQLYSRGLLAGKFVPLGTRKKILLIRSSSVDALRASLSSCITVTSAVKILGTSYRTTLAMLKDGIIKSHVSPLRRDSQLIKKDDIERLFSSLDTRKKRHSKRIGPLVSLRGALRSTNIPICDFLRLVLNGTISPVKAQTTRTGLHKYVFDRRDIELLKK